MANIVPYERGSLSYPKAVEEAIAELRGQGFITSDPVLEVCPHPSKNSELPDAHRLGDRARGFPPPN